MKRKTNSLAVCLLTALVVGRGVTALTAGAVEIDLGGTWSLTERDAPGYPLPIAVPGDVQSALLAAKRLADPYFGTNERAAQWPGQTDWTISRTFTVEPSVLAEKRIFLRLEDVDTFATVSVNGHPVGRTTNRFRRWEFDVKPYLKAGENTVSGHFPSAERKLRAARLGRPDFGQLPNDTILPLNYIRKPQCSGGWDWGVSLLSTGFCGPVRLIATSGATVDYAYDVQRFSDDLSVCDLTLVAEVTLADGTKTKVTKDIRVTDAREKLWWPNGMGAQTLLDFELDVFGRKVPVRVGLRKLEVENRVVKGAKGEASESSLVFKVNGVPLFAKGADWIPCDALANRQTPEKYRDLLDSMRAANMNMVRVWGGGQYEKDCFYDLCDELGLLVWQDFMFACAAYPSDEAFLDEVRPEAEHQVRRLRGHPALALWCGDNECLSMLAWGTTDLTPEQLLEGWRKKAKLVADVVRRCDPTRVFWPSSPCAGLDDFGTCRRAEDLGDMHYWAVWHANEPFEKYYTVRPRFCSEFGFQSYPSMEVAKTFCEYGGVDLAHPHFRHHQKNDGGNERIRRTMDRYFRTPVGMENVLYLSQVQQALAIKTAVEAWRHQMPHCMGTLFWQLNDNWPVSSWSSVEYGGKWKQLQYHARRFYAPVAVMATPAGKDAAVTEVWAVNDRTASVPVRVAASFRDFGGKVLSSETLTAELKPLSATLLKTYPAEPDAARRFLALRLEADGGRTVFRNERMLAAFKDSPVADATVTSVPKLEADGRWTVRLETDRPAFYVWANATGIPGEFDDNSFTLLPGEPRTLTFVRKESEKTFADFVDALGVRHLADTWHGVPKFPTNRESKSRFAEEVASPVRPDAPGGQPVRDASVRRFLYPPAFAFGDVKGAAAYRFEIAGGEDGPVAFEAASPRATLAPVWLRLPVRTPLTVTCRGIDASKREVGVAGTRPFARAVPFSASFVRARCPFASAVARTLAKVGKLPPAGRPRGEVAAACFEAFRSLEGTPGDAKAVARAQEVARWAEDRSVSWEKVPCASDEASVESAAWLVRLQLALYRATRDVFPLAKARALGETLVNVQRTDGGWPTDRSDVLAAACAAFEDLEREKSRECR